MAHRWVICLHIAFALRRTYIIYEDKRYKFSGLPKFTELGKCEMEIRKKWRTIENRCNFNNYDCYDEKDGNVINNTYKLLEFTDAYMFPAPKFIPGTIPYGIEKRLIQLGIEKPWLWFTSQLLGYMLLHSNKEFERKYLNGVRMGALQRPIVGVHFRGGDSLREGRLLPFNIYKNKIEHIFKHEINSTIPTRYIYFATDHTKALREMKAIQKSSKLSYIIKTNPLTGPRYEGRDDMSPETMEKILMDIFFLVRCDYVIVPLTSNVGRLVWELRMSQYPYGVHIRDTVIPVSGTMYYSWVNYNAEYIYYLAVKDNHTPVKVGDDMVIRYKKGDFARALLRERKTVLVDGISREIGLARSYRGFESLDGYVYMKDFIEWPGKTHYGNDM